MTARKPNGYWTKEHVLYEARKYSTRKEWYKNSRGGVKASQRLGCYEEAVAHMTSLCTLPNTWTKEAVLADARKYETKKEWSANSSGCVKASKRLGCYEEAVAHMKEFKKAKDYWTKDRILAEAKKYRTKSEWAEKCSRSYTVARQSGYLDEATAHMDELLKPSGYWTEERILESAREYSTRSEWKDAEPTAYAKSRAIGIHHKATAHMKHVGDRKHRCIYSIQIKDTKKIYIGLSFNMKKRVAQHLKTKRFSKFNTEDLIITQITDYLDNETAVELEAHYIAQYKERGYKLLNRAKAGSLGGNAIKWTREAILTDAKRFKTRRDWANESGSAYNASLSNGWYEDASKHFIELKKPIGYWTEERVLAESKKYSTIAEWVANDCASYKAAKKLNCYERATEHMEELRKPKGYWTKERIFSHARQFSTLADWKKGNGSPYNIARENDWLDEATAHMKRGLPNGYWDNKERVLAEAKKYMTSNEWNKASRGSWASAKKHGWFEEATAHMVKSKWYLKKEKVTTS